MELTFIEDSQNDYDGKMIRMGKRRMMYDVVRPIQKFQSSPYNFTPVYRVASVFHFVFIYVLYFFDYVVLWLLIVG